MNPCISPCCVLVAEVSATSPAESVVVYILASYTALMLLKTRNEKLSFLFMIYSLEDVIFVLGPVANFS